MRAHVIALLISIIAVSVLFDGWPDPPAQIVAIHVKADRAPRGAQPLFVRAPAELAQDRLQAELRSGRDVPDLSTWWRLEVPKADAKEVLAALSRDPSVEASFAEPHVEPASFDFPGAGPGSSCPVKTPSYSPYQIYLAEAPAGINAPAAWVRGARGHGIQIADVEGGWNETHEDIPGERMEHVAGTKIRVRGWEAHGTAVVGVVAAKDNGIGMVGIAPDVERIYTASLHKIGVAAAIDAAQAKLRPGDVLIIELHGVGPRGRWLPMEFWQDVFDVISVATARGVVVVEAGGNGGENLDHPAYDGKFDRAVRDSGALMVGAGAPARRGFVDRSRLSFSNFGARLDLQGWGWAVATLDYGDLQNCGAHERKYTDAFNGTSSASPVVAGAVVLIQNVARDVRGEVLAPVEVIELLGSTGSPQVDGPHGPKAQRIGPRPDLGRAIQALEAQR